MKKAVVFWVVIMGCFLTIPVFSQNEDQPRALGLPGDNLNLYAVLDVFQKSKTLEDFEKVINDKESNINNLDLNDDKFIDYIKVVSQKEGDTYYIILQVPINKKENQDVAVISVSKDKSGKPLVQIVGDEELYGKNYVIEPSDENLSVTPNPGYNGEPTTVINNTTNIYNNADEGYYAPVEAWPVVVYLFSPVFVVYSSPFYWGFYPSYWHPWAPVFYYNYWGYHSHYHHNHHYRRGTVIINAGYYSSYYDRRNRSNIVVTNRRNGTYNATYNGRDYSNPVPPTRNPIKQGPTRQNPIQAPTRTSPTRSNTTQPGPIRQSQLPTRRSETVKSNRQPTSATRRK